MLAVPTHGCQQPEMQSKASLQHKEIPEEGREKANTGRQTLLSLRAAMLCSQKVGFLPVSSTANTCGSSNNTPVRDTACTSNFTIPTSVSKAAYISSQTRHFCFQPTCCTLQCTQILCQEVIQEIKPTAKPAQALHNYHSHFQKTA